MSNYSSAILADLPQVYYRLSEPSGSVAFDSSGNNYNAALYGSYIQQQPGAIPTDADTSTYFTGSAGLQLPYTLNTAAFSAISIEFWTNANGSWQHIVATCDGTNTLVYVNAVVTTPAIPANVEISSVFHWAGSFVASNLDEVAIYNYVLSPAQISNHYTIGSAPLAVPGSPGGVRLLISDVHYPTIRQENISIDRTANDPIPTFKINIQDDPSHISISELQEVIFLDCSAVPNPTHNLLQNPNLAPYTSSYTQITTTGGSFSAGSPGVVFTASNAVASFGLAQNTQNGLVVPGQSYMLSCWVSTGTLSNVNPFLTIIFQDASGNILNSQSLVLGTVMTNTRYSVSGLAPNGTATIQANIGMEPSNATNSGAATFSNIQLEPMSFTSGATQQGYPTPYCANGQSNCTVMPDGTTIRQSRLFGGLVTKATAGNYIGNNRQWQVQVSGYAWLLQKQILNDSWSNTTDKTILTNIVTKYFPNQFSTAQVAQGATLNTFGYTFNGTARDAVDALAANSNFYVYIDAYRVIWYQPPGYNMLPFTLSDKPDGITSFPYYNYSLDYDGTQLGNATIVTGATNISAVEYDAQSIGYYNQKTNGSGIFWRAVNDSTITSTTAAQQRAIAENTQYNYARKIAHLTTNQMMIPGYTVLFSSATDDLYEVSFIIQRATLVLMGFSSLQTPYYECQCDIGAWNPDLVNITVKMLRKQLVNVNNIGTPAQGLMATESMTFFDVIKVSTVTSNPATYGMGVYGVATYAASVPGVPPAQYGVNVYGDSSKGYN